MKKVLGLAVCTVLSAALLVGCGAKDPLRAGPAPDSGFIEEPERMAADDNRPFQRTWIAPGFRHEDYSEVLVVPVDTSHIEKMSWWQKASIDEAVGDDSLQQIASYFQKSVEKAFSQHEHNRFTVVETPGPNTLVLELALVEVVPTKVWLNTIGLASMVVHGPASLSHGTTAMEGRLRDGTGGDPIALFADREFGQMSIVSAADMQWHAHTRHTIDRWSKQFVEIANKPMEARTKNAMPFTLKPW